ncbi:hypothetical protein P378_10780 [Desulforamulus profundi]|uniref:Uncharacterized protein n=1 Tax=Desulforamulus profundi TaxID=1383067 RepID=A0A2C6MDW7_9FIRM|nr:hypothetical protein [Desulforamulus profundi]PHJ38308.1 hypothetical protein P378_10780 [Desulforamulus profundi]
MQNCRYEIFLLQNNVLGHIRNISPILSQFRNSQFLAVNGRLKRLLLGSPAEMLDLDLLCREHGVKPKGVIHIGAHEGKEL